MASHPSTGWRRTVGPQWSSVKRTGPAAGPPPGMQQSVHSSYFNAISRPDFNPDYQQQQQQQLLHEQHQQHHLLQQQQQQQQHHPQPANADHVPDMQLSSSSNRTGSFLHTDTLSEHQRALLQHQENQRQQELYLQQLQLMQRLQAMPGSTARPWYPTFGPAITTSCSDNTIQLDNPNQFLLINNAKLNRHAVGPHWRSIQTSATYSPTPSPPSSSPQLQPRTIAPSSLSSSISLSTASTTAALHAHFSATYSSAASIDHARATSFHQQDQDMGVMSESSKSMPLLNPVHKQYYQSHSYPHDPRHHLLHNQPGNSREARENLPLTNRASPALSTSTRPSHPRQNSKRKASSQDEEDSDRDENNEEHQPLMQAFQVSSSSFTAHSSIQQFVPDTLVADQSPQHEEQDQEMDNAEIHSSTHIASTTSSRMTIDEISMDQDDMDTVFVGGAGELKLTKRTKLHLDPTAQNGMVSATEMTRLQAGERVQNLLQECFYNAATSSTSR